MHENSASQARAFDQACPIASSLQLNNLHSSVFGVDTRAMADASENYEEEEELADYEEQEEEETGTAAAKTDAT